MLFKFKTTYTVLYNLFYLLKCLYNPLHTDAFNELIENLKEKNPTWNKTTFNYERPVTRSLFMEENSDGDR